MWFVTCLLIFIQIERIQHPTLAVDQYGPTAVYNPFEVIGQFGQLVLAGERQGLGLVLYFGRQSASAMNLPF